jgi:hypothetical protein
MFYTKKKEIKLITSIFSRIDEGSFPLELTTIYFEIPFDIIPDLKKVFSKLEFMFSEFKGIFYVLSTFELNEFNVDATVRLMIISRRDEDDKNQYLKLLEEQLFNVGHTPSHIEKKKLGKLDLMIEINPIQFYGSKSKLTLNLLKKFGVRMTRYILKEIENPLSIIYNFKPPILQ